MHKFGCCRFIPSCCLQSSCMILTLVGESSHIGHEEAAHHEEAGHEEAEEAGHKEAT